MAIKYLYIDDEPEDTTINGTLNGLNPDKRLKITFKRPKKWNLQIDIIKRMINNHGGLILDLKFDESPIKVSYRGSTLAQEIRTLIKEGIIKYDFPIFLLSVSINQKKSFDETSEDLFDFRISKEAFSDGFTYQEFIDILVSYGAGYKYLQDKTLTLEDILKFKEIDLLDDRFTYLFNEKNKLQRHDLVRFLTRQVLEKTTFLINEATLAARLGIRLDSPDWGNLLAILKETKYLGVFGDYYLRWWMPLIELWWEETIDKENSLRGLEATERVRKISEKFQLKEILPIEKGQYCRSSKFWTICKGTGMAIDTIDGLVIANQDNNYPWQEKEYVSISEALRPSNKTYWNDVAIIERNRLQQLKEMYLNESRIRK